MYLLNPLAFARDLRADRVSERSKSGYMFFGMVVQATAYTLRSSQSARSTSPLWSLLALALTGLGTYVCYRTNAAGDDRRFVERFICLAAPLSFWLFLGGIAIGAGLCFGLGVRGDAYRTASGAISMVTWVVYFLALRWLIGHASKHDPMEPPPLPGRS